MSRDATASPPPSRAENSFEGSWSAKERLQRSRLARIDHTLKRIFRLLTLWALLFGGNLTSPAATSRPEPPEALWSIQALQPRLSNALFESPWDQTPIDRFIRALQEEA